MSKSPFTGLHPDSPGIRPRGLIGGVMAGVGSGNLKETLSMHGMSSANLALALQVVQASPVTAEARQQPNSQQPSTNTVANGGKRE